MGSDEVRTDIALDVFLAALPGFMRYLDSGRFDEAGPASVQSFFIGACRNVLPAVANRRHKNVGSEYPREDLLDWVNDIAVCSEGADLRWMHRLLQLAPHDLARVLMLVAMEGVTFNQASLRLGKKPGTMRSQLNLYRRKLVALHFAAKVDIPEATALGRWVRDQGAAA
ncbi:sigma-70 family RNA polymerase sigma factor [Gordonia sp. CPCC 205515]|uniref:RNA polymerase sigma factor n=1 Tax=Gordonia sp. CPCC 205515 TaxID=3140791 RepID=UPI003AF33CDC